MSQPPTNQEQIEAELKELMELTKGLDSQQIVTCKVCGLRMIEGEPCCLTNQG
jgi:hypothetical protein